LVPFGELEEGHGFKIDASSDDQCGISVESEDTFSKEYPFDEPSLMESSEVTPHTGLSDPIHMDSFLDIASTPPFLPFSSSLLLFLL